MRYGYEPDGYRLQSMIKELAEKVEILQAVVNVLMEERKAAKAKQQTGETI